MKTKLLGWVSLICLILTVLWLVLRISDTARFGAIESPEQAIRHARRTDSAYLATYVNAAIITLTATALFAGLYRFLQDRSPYWAAIGLTFVPVYTAFNLFAYLSQVSIVPAMSAFVGSEPADASTHWMIAMMVQAWQTSAAAFINALAYAILGIPLIIFGVLLSRSSSKSLAGGGWLLGLNGVACMVGMVGMIVRQPLLSMGVMAGGVSFLLALIPISTVFLKGGSEFD